MNRAKRFCIEIQNSELYKTLEKSSVGNFAFRYKANTDLGEIVGELTDLVVDEIVITREFVKSKNHVRNVLLNNLRLEQDKVVEVNMVSYLKSLERHSRRFIPVWYNSLGEEKNSVFDYNAVRGIEYLVHA